MREAASTRLNAHSPTTRGPFCSSLVRGPKGRTIWGPNCVRWRPNVLQSPEHKGDDRQAVAHVRFLNSVV
jgi:hypothetical protein